ncbi:cell division protein FtsL [Leptotrichia alba]|uniref:Cell division protein FtsL n=1 Tax=Leptotrichia alba TaxID=3239304 RepID=A0AB39V2T6_9FUSO
MNGVSKNKKIQMEILDVPKITNSARSYEDAKRKEIVTPKEVRRQLSRTAGLNKKAIKIVMFYVSIITAVALLRAFVLYNVSDLGKIKTKKERELTELKKEVARIDNEFISNNDLKTKEKEAKATGFTVPNDPTYINLNK